MGDDQARGAEVALIIIFDNLCLTSLLSIVMIFFSVGQDELSRLGKSKRMCGHSHGVYTGAPDRRPSITGKLNDNRPAVRILQTGAATGITKLAN
ncbi:hypothetical protein [Ruegeria arenilitoris]|uniref:hypothetical protein n=1 Tax=Ruegeria arenilitoris TaxID=1173585 RepID=UPI00147A2FC7|nr:hypothetical protein [Ruegeria arenilitoris]